MSEEDLSEPNEIETVEEDADAAPGDVESEVPRELTDADRAKLSELDEEIAKFEGQKRWSDVVRRVLAKVDIVVDQAEQVALLRQAGMLYLERSSNQAEAIKCFERLLKLEPRNTGALTRLEQMYEKRRDWEKLVRVRQQAAELMDELDRPLVYLEIAKLASQRLRKPQVCIDLWQQVLGVDPDNPEALEELSTLYERSREWEPLAKVLEQISQGERNEATLKQQLQKLGTIYADKIGDDSAAVHAFQRLLELDPEDRRAQEQLKRRFVALRAWDQLEAFYAQSDKWDELIRIFEREAEGTEIESSDRIALLFRAAKLWQENKEKPERAARAYEKVLAIDPSNLKAAEALSPIYEKSSDAKKLVAVYEVRLQHFEDSYDAVPLLRETAMLYEERLRDLPTAFEKHLQAFAAQPYQESVREDVERVANEIDGGWERLTEAYRSAIQDSVKPDHQIELRMSFGAVLRRVGRIEESIEQFRAVYASNDGHQRAIHALGELYRQTGQYRELMEIYERRMELEVDLEVQRDIAYSRASLLHRELSDPAAAIRSYSEILEKYGNGEADAFRALDELYFSQEMWPELASILARRIELGPESHEELAALNFRLGRTLQEHLDEKARAIELFRQVLTLMPEHDGARESLESLLGDAEVGVDAAMILEPHYESREDYQSLIGAIRVLHGGSDRAEERLGYLTKIGDIYANFLHDTSKAFDAFAEAVREMPESEETLSRLEVFALEQDRFRELVELVGALAAAVDDPVLSRSLWTRAARMYEEQLDELDGAVVCYGKCLDLDPGDIEVLHALEVLYRRTERWAHLVSVLHRRAEVSSDVVEQEELLSQIAVIHDQSLQDPSSAITTFKHILELDPTSARALSALDDLYARQEMWAELADNVDRQLELATDEAQSTSLMLRLAALRETRMGAADAAIEIYRDVLDRNPRNPEALVALERLIQDDRYQSTITETLEPIYRDANEFEKLIGVCEIQAQHASSPDRKVELLHQISELHEVALDDPAAAFDAMSRAFLEDPANPSTQDDLERLVLLTGDAEAHALIYESRVSSVEEPTLAAQLYVKAAHIREEQLGDVPRAVAHYKRVFEYDDQHLEAATALERLYQLSEQYDELAGIYLKKSGMLTSIEDQKVHLFQAGAIYEEILELPLEAIRVYDRVLEIDPEDLPALDKLIELYLRLENWEQLLGVYTRKAEIVVDAEDKKRLYVEVGAVYEREVGNTDKAIDTYQRILEIDPDDLTAIGRLDALYQATENWQELLSVLEREADLAVEPIEVISYRYRIAELWHHRLDDSLRAVDIYQDILEVIPEHEPTLAALELMISSGTEAVAAAGVLESVYRQLSAWSQLIAILEVQVRHEEESLRKVQLLHQVASLYELELHQSAEAFDAFARALPLDSTDDHTLSSIERFAEQHENWSDLVRLYDLEVERNREDAPDRVVDLALRAAKISEVRLGDTDAAITRYRIVIDVDPAHIQAIEALDRLYEATQQWAELAEILDKELTVAATPDEVLQFQFRLGQVQQHHLGNISGAIEQYRDILAAAPEHQPALNALELLFANGQESLVVGEILEPLYRMTEQWDRLLVVHEALLDHQNDLNERISMMHRMAEIAEHKAHDQAQAFLWMQRALLEDPTHDHSQMEVERLAQLLDGWSQLSSTYADVVIDDSNSEVRSTMGRRLARVYEEELGDVARAEETYRFVLSVDSLDSDALSALDRIYTEHGAYVVLTEVLKRRIDATDDPDDKVELSFRLGTLLDQELNHTQEAISVFRRLLDQLNPDHTESIRALQEIYTHQADWPSLYQAFEKELDVVFGDQAQSQIVGRMARLAAEKLGDASRGVELWKRVLDLRGEDPEALNALGDIYASQENWRDAVDMLEREVNVVDDDSLRVSIYEDLGCIWYEKLNRDRNALESWERVLDIDPTNTTALFRVADIFRNGKQHHEVVDTLHRIIDVGAALLGDSELEGVYTQLAQLYFHELKQPTDAIDAYRHALDINPTNFETIDSIEYIHREESQWVEAIEIMELRVSVQEELEDKIRGLLGIAQMWAEKVGNEDGGTSAFARVLEHNPSHQVAFERLEALHVAASRWADLIELYVGRVESTDDVRESVVLLRRIAKVHETELEDLNEAFDALALAWQLDYEDEQTSIELERVTAAGNRWNDLLTTANQALKDVAEPTLQIAICLNCAKWYGQELNHPEYAIPYYQQILTLDAGNVPAMRQMAELYRTTQQWETLGQVLARLVDITDDPAVRADTYVQMGDLCGKRLAQPDQARAYYQRALETEPSSLGAMEALESIYLEAGEWHALLKVQKQKASVLTDPNELQTARLRVAETYEDRLQDVESAIAEYRLVLEEDNLNISSMKGLERLYARAELWQELLGILELQYDVVTTEKERIHILARVASMYEEQFVKPDKAAERLEQILDIDPIQTEALHGLARLYRNVRRWDDLIQTYERHISVTSDREEKIRIFRSVGDVYATELEDLDRAIDSYLNVISIDDSDIEALDALTRLYEKRGDYPSALEMMEQLAHLLGDPEQQVDLRFRMGRIQDEHLGDRHAALEYYQGAIDIDPGHLPSLELMRSIHIDSGDWLAAARSLQQEAEYQENPRIVARLLVQLGQLFQERLDEPAQALQVFEQAFEKDPDNEDAALPLAEEYFAQERFAHAFPLLDLLVKLSSKRDAADQHRLAFMLGETASRLDADEDAIKAYTKAFQVDSTHLPSLIGLASAYYRIADWDNAFKFFQMLLVHHRDYLDKEQITEIFCRLGMIKREQGERRKALNMFDKALEEDAFHRPTLEAVIDLYETDQEWEQVIHFKKQLLVIAHEEDERSLLLEEIGDLWKEKLGNNQKSIEAWSEASTSKPDDHRILHKLLVGYQETRQWQKAIDAIEHISELDSRPTAKAKYAYTVAVIYRDELKDADSAIAKLNESLDLDHSQLKAFEAINKILNQTKDWKQLERAFRKMLHRILGKGDTDLEFNLWHNLGIIYRDRQRDYEAAAEAFRMASANKPEDPTEHQILAELYSIVDGATDKAIAEHQWLLRQDPHRVESYQALYKLYFDARAYDKAWCLASTLSFLKKADAEQQQFCSQYKQGGMIRPNNRVDNTTWLKDLFHPQEDLFVSKMMEALAPAVHAAKMSNDKALRLHKKFLHDPASSTVTFARTFGFVSQVLNVPIVPRLYLQSEAQGGLMHVPGSSPPAIVCGATLLQGFSPQDLAFIIGRYLAYYRPEHFIRTMITSHTELRMILLAGLALAGVGPQDPAVMQTAAQLQSKLQQTQVDAVRGVARKFVDAGAHTDIKAWMQHVELTAIRAGFVVCGDLEVASRVIRQLPPEGSIDLPPNEKTKDLVLFSVSENYFSLREKLGIQIQV